MNTFSWVICKCQSGNRAEREREREKPGKYSSNLSVRGLFILSEPRGKAGGGRNGCRRGEEKRKGRRRKGTEARNTQKRGWDERGGELWMENEESESGKTV